MVLRTECCKMKKTLEEQKWVTLTEILDIKSNKNLFLTQAAGNGMINAGIKDGDFIMMEKTNHIENGNICAIELNGKCYLKTLRRLENGVIELSYQDGISKPIVIKSDDNYKILGRLYAVLRRIKYTEETEK